MSRLAFNCEVSIKFILSFPLKFIFFRFLLALLRLSYLHYLAFHPFFGFPFLSHFFSFPRVLFSCPYFFLFLFSLFSSTFILGFFLLPSCFCFLNFFLLHLMFPPCILVCTSLLSSPFLLSLLHL